MIILGKDKIDERYNIDDNGIITDLQGNIQETTFYRDRPIFKSQAIHKIQMWTKFGYRDTKIWVIHHIDQNKLNNSIDNLVFLTKAEHSKLHKPFLGHHHSEETKMKISVHYVGMTGKHHSEEARKKISDSIKKYWQKKNYK